MSPDTVTTVASSSELDVDPSTDVLDASEATVEAPRTVAEAAALEAGEALPSPRHIAIVGFTTSRQFAPFGQPGWEVWGMNNLHLHLPPEQTAGCTHWFDLHPNDDIRKDEPHVDWLTKGSGGMPCYVWDAPPEWPNAVEFPAKDVMDRFGRYFTNSVSWMIALAIERLMPLKDDGGEPPSIGVYGIDMAQGTEYSAQRPSVEYFLGLAVGLGITLHIPEESDLLKTAGIYGLDNMGGLRSKLTARARDLDAMRVGFEQQRAQLQQQLGETEAKIHQCLGAQESNNYLLGTWFMPDIDRDQSSLPGQIPEPAGPIKE